LRASEDKGMILQKLTII